MPDDPSEESTEGRTEGVRAVGGPARATAARRIEALLCARRHALVIGIDAYAHEVGPLAGAVADARAVADVLRDPSRRDRFDPVTLLVDDEATRDGIEGAFAALKAQLDAAPGASVLIYFAGHGLASALPEEAETDTPGYLLPQDARRGDASSFVSMRALRGWIDALRCHHLLLVLDCCFAGAFRWVGARAARATPRQLYHERLERHLRDPAWHVITSAAHDERALDVMHARVKLGERARLAEGDRSGARSPFAVAFVEGLQGNADFASATTQRPDGVITGGELHTYLEHRFGEWEGEGRRFQKPLLFPWPGRRDNKGEFVFLNPRETLRLESAGELLEANNPYRGLRSFRYDARDTALFFGRDALVGRLCEKVTGGAVAEPDASRGEPVVVVLGASGTGKSSLVAAGLLPKLAAADWAPACDPVRPGGDPLEALRHLAKALDPGASDEPLAETARRFFARDLGARRVIVIDQLEELVTLRQGRDHRGEFLAALEGAADAAGGRLRVVYTLRSDFEPHFARELIAKHPGGRFRVTPLSREELREVIEGPAEACVLQFTPPELVDAILEEVVDAPGALPLLSFTLSEMYLHYVRAFREGRRDDRALTWEDYERLGRVEGSLSRRADDVYERFDAATRATMRRVMLRMLSIEGGHPTRRPAMVRELTYGAEEDARVQRVLRELTESRLVVSAADERGGEFVEPAHDKIVLGWPRLIEWLNEPGERERLDALQLVRERAADWVSLGREGGWLDRDARLDRWAELDVGEDSPFNAEEAALLRGSLQRRHEAREEDKRRVAALEDALSRARDHARMSALRDVARDPTAQVALLREVERPERVLRWEETARALLAAPDVAQAVVKDVWVLSLSPDGEHMLVVCGDRHICVRRTDGAGEPVFLQEAPYSLANTIPVGKFSPDGLRIALVLGVEVRVWRVDRTGGSVTLPRHLAYVPPLTPRIPDEDEGVTTVAVPSPSACDPKELTPQRVLSVSFSPDGARVITTSYPTAHVCRADGTGELVVLRGHEGAVTSGMFSPDGMRVVTASVDGTARVWRADGTGEPVVIRHENKVTSALFSPDGTYVLTTCEDGTARVWSADGAGSPVALRGSTRGANSVASPLLDAWASSVSVAAFSPDGARAVTVSKDNQVRVWRADGAGEPVVLRGHEGSVISAEFSSDGQRVLIASESGMACVCRADGTGQPLVLSGGDRRVYFAAFLSDSVRVLTGGTTTFDDRTARLWRGDRTEPVALRGHEGKVISAVFSPDGARVLTVAGDGSKRVWRADRTGEPVVLWQREAELTLAVFSPDRKRVVTVSKEGMARVRQVDGADEPVVLRAHSEWMDFATLMFSPDSTHILTRARDCTVCVWRDGASEPTVLRGHTGEVTSASFSPDGMLVVTASKDGTARVWRADGAGEPVVLRGHGGWVTVAAFSPDGARAVSAARDGTVRVWRIDGADEPVVLRGFKRYIDSAVFSSDGVYVIIVSHDLPVEEVRICRADGTGEAVAPRCGGRRLTNVLGLSPDGVHLLATTEGGSTCLCRVDCACDPVTLPLPPYPMERAAFSPDGEHLIVVAYKVVYVCRADGTGELVTLEGHEDAVTSASFSPDGTRVLTVSGAAAFLWRWARWRSIPEMLWGVTTYCLPVKERIALLGETEQEATERHDAARQRVDRERPPKP